MWIYRTNQINILNQMQTVFLKVLKITNLKILVARVAKVKFTKTRWLK